MDRHRGSGMRLTQRGMVAVAAVLVILDGTSSNVQFWVGRVE